MKKISSFILSLCLLFLISPTFFVKAKQDMHDESIYDIIVDRFVDGNPANNGPTNLKEPFMGGDFEGVRTKASYFKKLRFSYISLGSLAKAEDYRGKKVVDYGQLQPYFGTEADYQKMREALNKEQIKVIADFPINGVSEKNVLIPKGEKVNWAKPATEKGTVNWNLENKQVKKALMKAAADYAYHNQVDGIRLTGIQGVDPTFLNDLMLILKASNPDLVVLSDDDSDANFDVDYDVGKMKAFQEVFKKPNATATSVVKNIREDREVNPRLLMIDDVNNTRFSEHTKISKGESSPQLKLALTTLFTLPGTPIMMYGTENEMSGKNPPDTLGMMEFKENNELTDYIRKLQKIRSDNPALRNGSFKLLNHQDGFVAYERYDDKKKWLVVVNNTDQTQQMNLSEKAIGKNRELVSLLDGERVYASPNQKYRVALDREQAEIFEIQPRKSVDFPYLSLAVVGTLFVLLMITIVIGVVRKKKGEGI